MYTIRFLFEISTLKEMIFLVVSYSPKVYFAFSFFFFFLLSDGLMARWMRVAFMKHYDY